MQITIHIEGASADVLSAIAKAMDGTDTESRVTTFTAGAPVVHVATVPFVPHTTASKPIATGPRPRGRPKGSKGPGPVVESTTPEVEQDSEPEEVVVPEPIAPTPAPEPVVPTFPTLFAAMEAYVQTFSFEAARAVAKREGVAKFGEIDTAKHPALIAEMAAAIATGVPLA